MSSIQTFVREETLPVSAAESFAWHERPGAFERLTPPWERVELVGRSGDGLQPGARVTLRTRVGPVAMEWVAEHTEYVAGRMFRDVALRGPFASWDHRHEFLDTPVEGGAAGAGCTLRDRVKYSLPGGVAGRVVAGGLVRRKLAALFAYRQAVTRDDLQFALDHAAAPKLRVLVTGASGLVGRALAPFLTSQGHEVVRLARREAGRMSLPRGGAPESEPWWDPASGEIDLTPAGRIDAVVHLAGAGIADARWTDARRAVLRESRVSGTRLLAEALAKRPVPPRVVVGGSAIGYYGDAGNTWLDEAAPTGTGFLADLTRDWEAAWAPLDVCATRRVYLRTGLVLSPAGGALAKLLTPFSLGLGGATGHGRQWWSWISIDDLVGVIGHALADEMVRGPLNSVGPEPVTSAEFARTLGRVLRRPALLPTPALALRLALGRGLADEALMASQRVRADVLRRSGYRFRHGNLETALRHVLGRVA